MSPVPSRSDVASEPGSQLPPSPISRRRWLMSELRTRMLRDMTVRGFSPRTHEAYIRQVVGLARHYRRSPDQLSADEVQAYLPISTRRGNARGAPARRRRMRFGFSTTSPSGARRRRFRSRRPGSRRRCPTSSAGKKSGACSARARLPGIAYGWPPPTLAAWSPTASSASATSACSPIAAGRRRSPSAERSWPSHPRRPSCPSRPGT